MNTEKYINATSNILDYAYLYIITQAQCSLNVVRQYIKSYPAV